MAYHGQSVNSIWAFRQAAAQWSSTAHQRPSGWSERIPGFYLAIIAGPRGDGKFAAVLKKSC